MANVRLERRLAELESKTAARHRCVVLDAPDGLYAAEYDAWRQEQHTPPGAFVIIRSFVSPGDPIADEERTFLLLYLRDFAGPDGLLPVGFDDLVRQSFGSLVADL